MGTWHLMGFLTLLFFLTCDGKRDCKVVPLKARPSIKADVIFSGTVKRFLKNPIDQLGRKSKFFRLENSNGLYLVYAKIQIGLK